MEFTPNLTQSSGRSLEYIGPSGCSRTIKRAVLNRRHFLEPGYMLCPWETGFGSNDFRTNGGGALTKKRPGRPAETRYAQRILVQLGVAAVAIVLVGLWQREFLAEVYLRNQLTQVGWMINGGIVLLFGGALVRLIQSYLRYDREEQALNRFLANVQDRAEPGQGSRTGTRSLALVIARCANSTSDGL